MIAYVATLILGVALALTLATNPPEILGFEFLGASAIISALGLLTRDIAIFLFFPLLSGSKRGEAPAIITLVMLYNVAPQLAGTTGVGVFFYPFGGDLGLMGPLIAWGEAALMWFVLYRVAGKNLLPNGAENIPVNAQPERK
jgi:hypothetical protein